MIDHQDAIQLIIGYTCVGAFVFTVVVTCLSLIGWVKLADRDNQEKLFAMIVSEDGRVSDLIEYTVDSSSKTSIKPLSQR